MDVVHNMGTTIAGLVEEILKPQPLLLAFVIDLAAGGVVHYLGNEGPFKKEVEKHIKRFGMFILLLLIMTIILPPVHLTDIGSENPDGKDSSTQTENNPPKGPEMSIGDPVMDFIKSRHTISEYIALADLLGKQNNYEGTRKLLEAANDTFNPFPVELSNRLDFAYNRLGTPAHERIETNYAKHYQNNP